MRRMVITPAFQLTALRLVLSTIFFLREVEQIAKQKDLWLKANRSVIKHAGIGKPEDERLAGKDLRIIIISTTTVVARLPNTPLLPDQCKCSGFMCSSVPWLNHSEERLSS